MPSLAQQLAELDSAAPQEFDGDDLFEQPPQADHDRDHYLDVGPSALRKLADNELDPKYDARKISRQQLAQDDTKSHDSEDGSDDQPDAAHDQSEGYSDDDTPAATDDQSHTTDSGDDRSDSGDDEHPSPADDHLNQPDQSSSLKTARKADISKGKAVVRQRHVWDALVDTRIRLQKAIQVSRQLPDTAAILQSDDGLEAAGQFFEAALSLSTALFDAQEILVESAASAAPPPRKRRKLASGTLSPVTVLTEARHRAGELAALDQAYHPHLVSTLHKWNTKIQAVSPGFVAANNSNINAFSKKRTADTRGILELVEEVQAKRADARLQPRDPPAADGATMGCDWDDTDFYQQLLRDVIESRSSGSTGLAGAEPWQLNKAKRVKKAVDTKASKGRKLRYTVHEKIAHFMVPIQRGAWHEEQIDELFAGLLGRAGGKERREEGQSETMDVRMDDGFRLFG